MQAVFARIQLRVQARMDAAREEGKTASEAQMLQLKEGLTLGVVLRPQTVLLEGVCFTRDVFFYPVCKGLVSRHARG